MWYRVFLVNGHEDIEADMVRETNNYEARISDNQQPSICFYKGKNPTADNKVAQFMLKNISGYRQITTSYKIQNP